MWKEIKKIIAIKLLDWSYSIMPKCVFKEELRKTIVLHMLKGMD